MANKSHHTFKKNEREKTKQKKKVEKLSRKLEAKKTKEDSLPTEEGVDPDIAHIVPGPQPREEW